MSFTDIFTRSQNIGDASAGTVLGILGSFQVATAVVGRIVTQNPAALKYGLGVAAVSVGATALLYGINHCLERQVNASRTTTPKSRQRTLSLQ